MKLYTRYYKVAGITIEVNSAFPITRNTFHPKFRPFEVEGSGEENVRIYHHFDLPEDDKGQAGKIEIYKKNQWQIFKTKNSWIYNYTSLSPDDLKTDVVGIMNNDYTSIHIYTKDFTRERYQNAASPALTLFNTDQMIFTKLLSDRNGVMIHSNGFNINEKGIILAGISGSGKSTLSRMLKGEGHEILCDDRIFIRKMDQEFRIFGNWCYGSNPDVSSSSAPLKGFFFLKKGLNNRIVEIKDKNEISSKLMQVIVKPLLDVYGWEKHFITINELRKEHRFYQIEFDLSGRICNIINRFLLK